MSIEMTVETIICRDDRIVQRVCGEINDRKQTLMQFVIDTREKQIREALVKLGWTPPEPRDKAYSVEGPMKEW